MIVFDHNYRVCMKYAICFKQPDTAANNPKPHTDVVAASHDERPCKKLAPVQSYISMNTRVYVCTLAHAHNMGHTWPHGHLDVAMGGGPKSWARGRGGAREERRGKAPP